MRSLELLNGKPECKGDAVRIKWDDGQRYDVSIGHIVGLYVPQTSAGSGDGL